MSSEDTRLILSENESAVLGLKTGRCNAVILDADVLSHQILEGRYDICRLKIPAEDEGASVKLHRTGFPFFFSGSIRRYKTPISAYPPGAFYHPEMVYEMYDGSQDNLLREMITGTWGTYPVGYYRTPWLSNLVSKEAEIECLFRFYKKHNLNKDYPQNAIMFMKDGENYVGFFALNKVDGNLESHIGGILSPYRQGGYFLDMLRYIKIYCIDHQLPHFLFGARNENEVVQRIFQEVGFKAMGSENVFHIPSLLSHTVADPEMTAHDIANAGNIRAVMQQHLENNLQKMQASSDFLLRVKVTPEVFIPGGHTLRVTVPLNSENETLLVGVLENANRKVAAVGYACTAHYK